MRLIDADELQKDIMSYKTMPEIRKAICEVIDDAPTIAEVFKTGSATGIRLIERPQAKWYDCIPNCLKARHGKYVLYKVDYLLDNLAREIYLLERVRRMKGGSE